MIQRHAESSPGAETTPGAGGQPASAGGQKLQLLASLNHEIRTPLSGVLGAIDLLLETGLDDEQREYALMARESANSLLSLLNDTLEYTSLLNGCSQLDEAEFDLQETLQAAMAEFMATAEQRRLDLRWIVDPILPRIVHGDARRFAQLVHLLLRYAFRTVSAGGVFMGTKVEQTTRAGQLVLALTLECANGLPVEALRSLIDEFEADQNSSVGQFHSLALDLALARRVALLMQGDLLIEEAAGGVRLTARVPVRLSGPRHHDEQGHDPEADNLILVVDDNPVSQRVLRAVLAKGDYRVDCCADGPSALAAAASRRYRLVLMDLFMPGMDGLETLGRLRRIPGYEHTPVLALTAEMSSQLRQLCRQHGMAAFLTKPIHAGELLETIRRCLAAG
ncbi:MAG: response regulator [Bryobacteraceae bacterium]|nr:response regulator [Bryobacteraceae bacterium]